MRDYGIAAPHGPNPGGQHVATADLVDTVEDLVRLSNRGQGSRGTLGSGTWERRSKGDRGLGAIVEARESDDRRETGAWE